MQITCITIQSLTFTDQGLELGNGTLLVKYIRDAWDRQTLDIEGQEEAILALLSVAWDRPMPDGILRHFHGASRALAKGEMVQAYIHLAFAGLPPLERDSERLRLLFLAEGFLEAGLSGNEIRKACGLGRSGFCKSNSLHVPAGSPQGGQFAPKGGRGGGGQAQRSVRIRNVADIIESKMPPPAPKIARQRVVQAAENQEGNAAWDINKKRGPYPAGVSKCNLFVAEMLA